MVVGPGRFEAMSELLHGLGAFGAPEDDAERSGTDASDHPEKILHLRRLLIPVGCSETALGWVEETDYTGEYGFGEIWTRSRCWGSTGGEDGGVGGGRGYGS